MGLRSPFGNNGSQVPSPIPGQSLADLSSQAAIPGQVNVPSVGRAPAGAGAPAPSPTPGGTQQPAPASQMSPEEQQAMSQLGQMSPDELDALKSLPQAQPNRPQILPEASQKIVSAISDFGKKHFGVDLAPILQQSPMQAFANTSVGKFVRELPAASLAMAGGAAVADIAAPLGGAAALMAGSAGAGGSNVAVQKMMDIAKDIAGVKDDGERSNLMRFFSGAMGYMIPGGAGRMLEQQAGQYAAKETMAQTAASVSAKAIAQANGIGVDPQSSWTASGTPIGAEQAQLAQRIAAGKFGGKPQAELMAETAKNWAKLDSVWSETKQSMAPQSEQVFEGGINQNQSFQPHQYLPDQLDRFRAKIGGLKADAFNLIGDAKVDPTPFQELFRGIVGRDGLVKPDGQIDKQLVDLSDDTGRRLVREWLRVDNLTKRAAGAFKESGRGTPSYQQPFGSSFDQGAEAHVQDPLQHQGRLPTFSPTAGHDALPPGANPGQMDFDMVKTHPGSPPDALGDRQITDPSGVQPGLSGGGYVSPGGPNRFLPDGPAGDARSGIRLRDLDGMVDSLQEYWRYLKDKGDPAAGKFGVLQKTANELYMKGLAERTMDASPETAQMLIRYNKAYSGMVDNYTSLTDGISSNPRMAIAQIVRHDNPDEVTKLFHALPQGAGDNMRRLFLESVSEKAQGDVPDRLFDASQVKSQLGKYPEKTLDTMFGPKADTIKSIVDTAKNMQNVDMSGPNASAILQGAKIPMKIGQLPASAARWAIDLFRRNQPLHELMCKPDFSDMVQKYRTLDKYVGTSMNVGGVGLQGLAPASTAFMNEK